MKDLVDERDGDGSLADGGGDALDVAAAHVTDRKDSGTARFEQVGRPVQRPSCGYQVLAREIRAGLDEPVTVESDAAAEARPYWPAPPVITNTWRMSLVCAAWFRLSLPADLFEVPVSL